MLHTINVQSSIKDSRITSFLPLLFLRLVGQMSILLSSIGSLNFQDFRTWKQTHDTLVSVPGLRVLHIPKYTSNIIIVVSQIKINYIQCTPLQQLKMHTYIGNTFKT